MTPGICNLAAFEDDVIDRALAETVADREAGVPGADDDRRNAFDVVLRCLSVSERVLSGDLDRHVRRVGDDVVYR